MKRILVIDDDPDVTTVLRMLLAKNGYEAAIASNEEEANRQVAAFHPHLIVMDVLLSGVDGRTICKKLKAATAYKHIPIIMFSAHPSAQKNMDDFGADDFIPKPYQSQKILERIEALLSKSSQAL